MKSFTNDACTISVDLPGNGKSQVHAKQECTISTEEQRVVLVGYSMGARIALHMALNSDKIEGAVIISGSPGLKEESNRKIHQAIDKSRAKLLIFTWFAKFSRDLVFNQVMVKVPLKLEICKGIWKKVSGSAGKKTLKRRQRLFRAAPLTRREKPPNAGKKPINAGKAIFRAALTNAGKGIWKRRHKLLPTPVFLALVQAPAKVFIGVF